jgi:hypothetical protein
VKIISKTFSTNEVLDIYNFPVEEFILVNAAENSWQKLATLRTEKKKPVLPTLHTNFSAILLT